jgi:hypothetical protein
MLNYAMVTALGIDFGKIPLHFSAYSFIIAILAMVFVSLLTKRRIKKFLMILRRAGRFQNNIFLIQTVNKY